MNNEKLIMLVFYGYLQLCAVLVQIAIRISGGNDEVLTSFILSMNCLFNNAVELKNASFLKTAIIPGMNDELNKMAIVLKCCKNFSPKMINSNVKGCLNCSRFDSDKKIYDVIFCKNYISDCERFLNENNNLRNR